MPNQRGPNKKKVNLWLTEEEKAILSEAAKSLGLNVTDFVKESARRAKEEQERLRKASEEAGT